MGGSNHRRPLALSSIRGGLRASGTRLRESPFLPPPPSHPVSDGSDLGVGVSAMRGSRASGRRCARAVAERARRDGVDAQRARDGAKNQIKLLENRPAFAVSLSLSVDVRGQRTIAAVIAKLEPARTHLFQLVRDRTWQRLRKVWTATQAQCCAHTN